MGILGAFARRKAAQGWREWVLGFLISVYWTGVFVVSDHFPP